MGQVLHGSATAAVRRAIQHSEASLRALAKRYGINQKTVAKWKGRTSVADRPTGPKEVRSTVLSGEDEAIVVAFRRHTLLPLDDCLYALQPTLPHLTRSSLHRCLQRHGISRLPDVEGDKPSRRRFKTYALGFFHIPRPAGVCSQTPRGTSSRSAPHRASCISSWPSTGSPSSPSSNCTRKRPGASRATCLTRPGEGGALPRPHHPHGQWYPLHRSTRPRLCRRREGNDDLVRLRDPCRLRHPQHCAGQPQDPLPKMLPDPKTQRRSVSQHHHQPRWPRFPLPSLQLVWRAVV